MMRLEKGLKSTAMILAFAAMTFSACQKDAIEETGTPQTSKIEAGAIATTGSDTTVLSLKPNLYQAVTVSTISTAAPIGYAMVNGSTTGGAGGKTVTVSTLSAFRTAASSTSPMIIYVKGTISGREYVSIKSNKTIIGLSGATFTGISFNMNRVSNIIVKNLVMKNYTGDADAITIKYSTHHVWIDHCSFSGTDDGLVDITQQSDYITISWSKFTGATKASLVGSGDDVTADKGRLHVTYHHNFFLNDLERSPSIRFGTAHVFNNYYQTTAGYTNGYGMAARMGAVIRAENNYFDNIKGSPIRTLDPTPGYISGASTNYYKNCGRNVIQTSASSWVPTYSYQSQLHAAADVINVVKLGAGAK